MSLPPTTRRRPFQRTVLRGLAVILPPVLTVVIFLWMFGTVQTYLLQPVRKAALATATWWVKDIQYDLSTPDPHSSIAIYQGREYHRLENRQFVPEPVYERVRADPGDQPMPTTARDVYRRYVALEVVPDRIVIPVFLCGFVLLLYVLGKFLAAGVGNVFEWFVHRVPLVRNVYGSVKQVTDFMFKQAELRYTRVVAVEYPRPGIWGVGFVTGEGMLEVNATFGEPCWTVALPGSPMPVTGYAITVPKSKSIELNITVDQALQYLISGGVVIPPQQRARFAGTTNTRPVVADAPRAPTGVVPQADPRD